MLSLSRAYLEIERLRAITTPPIAGTVAHWQMVNELKHFCLIDEDTALAALYSDPAWREQVKQRRAQVEQIISDFEGSPNDNT